MTLVLGFDIGLSGAIAIYDCEQRTLLAIEDMPVDKITVGKAIRGRVSDIALLALLHNTAGAHAFLERPEIRPMQKRNKATGEITMQRMGGMGAFMFGEGYGIVHCAVIANGMVLTEVRPGIWKKAMGVGGDKDEARRRASELFPLFKSYFVRKMDDGRAEAALLALWGARASFVERVA